MEFTQEMMDRYRLRAPDRCIIKDCTNIAEMYDNGDEYNNLPLCINCYYEITDKIENDSR